VHYYKFSITAWGLSTAHLSLVEEAIYFRLVNFYYDTEAPIPLETQSVFRRLRMGNESVIAMAILDEFFVKTEKGYVHEHCEELLKEFKKTKKKNKTNGGKGGRPRKDAASSETQEKPSGFPDETESEPSGNPNHKPLTINQEPIKHNVPDAEDRERVPTVEVMKLFNRVFDTLPEVKVFNEKRKAAVRSRWRENPRLQSLESWERFFQWIKNSDFLMGRTEKPWTGFCFDWLVSPTNFAKIIEGNYHRGQQ